MSQADAQNFYYATTPRAAAACAAARASTRADVCVVGGGISGLSAALHLARARLAAWRCSRRRHLGFGGSGRSGGQTIFGYACEQDNTREGSWARPTRAACGISRSKA